MQAGPEDSPKANASPNMKDPVTGAILPLFSLRVCDAWAVLGPRTVLLHPEASNCRTGGTCHRLSPQTTFKGMDHRKRGVPANFLQHRILPRVAPTSLFMSATLGDLLRTPQFPVGPPAHTSKSMHASPAKVGARHGVPLRRASPAPTRHVWLQFA